MIRQSKCRDCGKITRIHPPAKDLPNLNAWAWKCQCQDKAKLANYGVKR